MQRVAFARRCQWCQCLWCHYAGKCRGRGACESRLEANTHGGRDSMRVANAGFGICCGYLIWNCQDKLTSCKKLRRRVRTGEEVGRGHAEC